jgi:hypothetical protein
MILLREILLRKMTGFRVIAKSNFAVSGPGEPRPITKTGNRKKRLVALR